jgi:adenylate kinase
MGLRIVMLGAPGAGKGTQAKRIAGARSLPHISTGDIFREHLRNGTDLGKQVQQYLDAGRLVPDELTCRIVADRLAQPDCVDGYILDGFPRSVPQSENLDAVLQSRGERLDVCLNIDVDDGEILDRLTARRSCSKCGRIYNLKFDPPKRANVCDDDGAALVHRKDDQAETIAERLRVYHETTEPIIAFYEKQGLLKTVSGTSATPDLVFARIEEKLAALDTD